MASKKTFKSTPKLVTAFIGFLILGLSLNQAQAIPKAVNQAPKGTELLIILPNLAKTSNDIAQWAKAIDSVTPQTSNTLMLLKMATGFYQGIRDDGAALIAFPNIVDSIKNNTEPQGIILIPISNYKQFAANFDAKADAKADGIEQIQLPNNKTAYIKDAGDYALLSKQYDLIKQYKPSQGANDLLAAAGQATSKILDQSDISICLDLSATGQVLAEKIRLSTDLILTTLENSQDKKQIQAAKAIYALYSQAAQALVKNGQLLTISLDVNPEGVDYVGTFRFNKDSLLAKYFPNNTHTSSLLQQMPDQPYIAAASYNAKAFNLSLLIDNALKILQNNQDPTIKLLMQVLPAAKNIKRTAWVWYTPEPNKLLVGGMLKTAVITESSTPQVIANAAKKYIKNINGQSFGPPETAATYETTYQENLLKIGNTSIDQYSVTMQFPPKTMMEIGQNGAIMKMLGLTNYTGYLATQGHFFIQTTIPDAILTKQLFQATTRADGLGSSPSLDQMRKKYLPNHLAAEGYLNIQSILQTADQIISTMTGNHFFQASGNNLPLVAMGLGIHNRVLTSKLHIPTATIKAVIQATKTPVSKTPKPAPAPETQDHIFH